MSIIAMKQALEALNHWGKDWPVKQQLAKETLQKAIDQAEKQEPVAWRWRERINSDFDSWVISASEPPPYAIEQQPLYTTPPQRKPLTDEEISNIWCKVSNTDFVTADTHEFARAIEAAHGIKE